MADGGKGFEEKPAADHAGHRERMRHRLRQHGPDSFADYELLEFLLFPLLPRRDTKAIAKALLRQFGSLSGVISAPRARLKEMEGIGDTTIDALKVIESCSIRHARSDIDQRKPLSSWSELHRYLQTAMAFSEIEAFRILFLDKRNGLIADEVQQKGTVDHTPVYPREIVRRALELSSTAIILVHNHPSGDPTPSRADIQMTRQIIDIAKPLGVEVHDHIIVGREGNVSFRGLQLI